jgi:hypothetical protein
MLSYHNNYTQEGYMENRKFYLGMLVLILAFAMTVVGCGDKSGPNNFDGKTVLWDEGNGSPKSTMKFAGSTWTWDNHQLTSNSVKYAYNIKGTYTCSDNGNIAIMKATEINGGSGWQAWSYNYFVRINSDGSYSYTSLQSKSIISFDELTGEFTGYQVR